MANGSLSESWRTDPPGGTEMGWSVRESVERVLRIIRMDGNQFREGFGQARKTKNPASGWEAGLAENPLFLRLSGPCGPGSASRWCCACGGKHSMRGMGAFAPNDIASRPTQHRDDLDDEALGGSEDGRLVAHRFGFGNAREILRICEIVNAFHHLFLRAT